MAGCLGPYDRESNFGNCQSMVFEPDDIGPWCFLLMRFKSQDSKISFASYRISRISVPRKCTLKMSDEYSKVRKNGQRTYQSWVRQIILLRQLHDNYVDTNTLLLTPKFSDVDVLLTALFLS
jgi:hypothetical protein